jgi:hypothetical protein
VDLVEFVLIAKAVGASPAACLRNLSAGYGEIEGRRRWWAFHSRAATVAVRISSATGALLCYGPDCGPCRI